LAEKRFEASFSVLLTPSVSPTHSKGVKWSTVVSRHSVSQSRPHRPSKTFHSSTFSAFKNTNEEKIPAPVALKKVRSNMLDVRETKSRLTEKLKMALDYS
jgi:hypothetical protein